MTFKLSKMVAASAAIFAFSVVGFAQETKTTQATPPPMERGADRYGKMGKMHGGRHGDGHQGGMLHALSELNLTDAQKQQINTIAETNKSATAAGREEFKQLMMERRNGMVLTPEQETRLNKLKMQLRAAGQKMNDDLVAVLTPEQQTQFKQKQTEMHQRHQERRQMKEQNGNPLPQNN